VLLEHGRERISNYYCDALLKTGKTTQNDYAVKHVRAGSLKHCLNELHLHCGIASVITYTTA